MNALYNHGFIDYCVFEHALVLAIAICLHSTNKVLGFVKHIDA